MEHRRQIHAIVIADREAFPRDAHPGIELHVKVLQLHLAIEPAAEFTYHPFSGAVVDIARAKKNHEDETGKQADRNTGEVRPLTGTGRVLCHQLKLKSEMLLPGEKFRVRGAG